MRRKLTIIVLIVACTAIFAACGNAEKSQIDEIQKKLNDANTKIEQLEQKLNEKQKDIDNLKAQNNQAEIKVNEIKADEVRLWDVDINTYKKIPTENIVSIDKKNSLEENVKKVAEKTIDIFFKNNKYEITFKQESGKNIIVLNLIDQGSSKVWYQSFQGSAGGIITSKKLIENILQRDYQGKWIDGLNVLYNGKKAEFQHAPDLENVIYR